MEIKSISDFRKAIRQGPYAWPGGYPLYFVMADGEALSFKAAKTERRLILEAIRDKANGFSDSDWVPAGVDVNYEDGELFCAHTNERIESAYAEPEDESDGKPFKVYGDYGLESQTLLEEFTMELEAVRFSQGYCRRDLGGYSSVEAISFREDGEAITHFRKTSDEE